MRGPWADLRLVAPGRGCGYEGPPVAKADDTPTADPAQDRCGKRLASCKTRFGATSVLPYGEPGVGLLR
ncbi:phage minor tail protein L [Myxococcus guangdongensis]|uniref:hypothetical protein n=1 Tax=Myxococcus guangdongensis TaxID=2906760 RepID=UPI0038991729